MDQISPESKYVFPLNKLQTFEERFSFKDSNIKRLSYL